MESDNDEVSVLPREMSSLTFQQIIQREDNYGKKAHMKSGSGKKHENRNQFHRENKNRPKEMSSKVPTKRINKIAPITKKEIRDPRFESSCGEYNPKIFDRNYKFIENIQKKERKILRRQLENEDIDEEERDEIRLLLQRMENKHQANVQKKRIQKQEEQERKERIQQLKEGIAPVFKKKSEKKMLDLVEQYELLKKKGSLNKYISKRRKKNAQKDKKKLDIIKR